MADRRIETLSDLVHVYPRSTIGLRCKACGAMGATWRPTLPLCTAGIASFRDLTYRCDGCGSVDVMATQERPGARIEPGIGVIVVTTRPRQKNLSPGLEPKFGPHQIGRRPHAIRVRARRVPLRARSHVHVALRRM
jgi:hypothetical protein